MAQGAYYNARHDSALACYRRYATKKGIKTESQQDDVLEYSHLDRNTQRNEYRQRTQYKGLGGDPTALEKNGTLSLGSLMKMHSVLALLEC